MSRRETRRQVRDALADLPGRQRTALALQEFHRYPIRDIGETMQVTPATAKGLLSRAKISLREKLNTLVRCA